jgi:hypothetical protein
MENITNTGKPTTQLVMQFRNSGRNQNKDITNAKGRRDNWDNAFVTVKEYFGQSLL